MAREETMPDQCGGMNVFLIDRGGTLAASRNRMNSSSSAIMVFVQKCHRHFRTSSMISRKISRLVSTLARPRPNASDRLSVGFLVVIALAICEAYR